MRKLPEIFLCFYSCLVFPSIHDWTSAFSWALQSAVLRCGNAGLFCCLPSDWAAWVLRCLLAILFSVAASRRPPLARKRATGDNLPGLDSPISFWKFYAYDRAPLAGLLFHVSIQLRNTRQTRLLCFRPA